MQSQSIRERRLNADYRRLKDLANHSEFIRIHETHSDPPEKYVILYLCPGITTVDAGDAVFSNEHCVEIFLPREYPLQGPVVRCLKPVYHPNIDFSNGMVCLDKWYPSRFLDEIVITIGRMIRYQNYNPTSPLHMEAGKWALRNRDRLPLDSRPFRRGQEDQRAPDGFHIRIV